MPRSIALHSGAVVGRYLDRDGETIVALVSLSTAEWDEVTSEITDLLEPGVLLEDRIEQFIDLTIQEWHWRKICEAPRDEDVPF